MKIAKEQVRYVASLARLHLSEAEIARMAHHLGGILDHMDSLALIDTEGVPPMRQVLGEEETVTLRPDLERAPLGNEAALANAPASGNGYFKVPRVIER